MPIKTLSQIKSLFQNKDKPSGSDFVDLIDTLAAATGAQINGSVITTGSLPAAAIIPNQVFQQLRTNIAGSSVEWFDNNATMHKVSQTAHGLVVGNAVYVDATGQYLQAKSNTGLTGQVVGVVSHVLDVDTFVISINGHISAGTGEWDALTGDVGGLLPGQIYYLSSVIAGGYQTIPPADPGFTITPVLVAITASVAYVIQTPAEVVGSTGLSANAIAKAWVNFDGTTGVSHTVSFADVSDGLDQITVTAHTFGSEHAVLLTTTGTLPNPLSTGTIYWTRNVDANTVELYPTFTDAVNDTNKIDITDQGTGNHTLNGGLNIARAYNVDLVEDLGAGQYKCYFTVPFLDASYAVAMQTNTPSPTTELWSYVTIELDPTFATVGIVSHSGGGAVFDSDATIVNVIAHGVS